MANAVTDTNDGLSCFVIGPIGDELAPIGSENRKRWEDAIEVWETVIAPACAAVDLHPLRADQITEAGEITEQTFRHLRDDDVVIADLTDANPNVMYELGLRHTVQKLTIQIGETGRLPFDVNVIRTIRFVRTPNNLNHVRDLLTETLRTGLAGGFQPVTATRLWAEARSAVATLVSVPADDSVANSADEPGYLEKIAEMESALPKLAATVQGWTAILDEMNKAVIAATEETAASDARGGGTAGRLLVANRLAQTLTPLCDRQEGVVQTYAEQMQTVDLGMSAIIDIIETNPSQLEQALPLVEQVISVSSIFKQTADSSVNAIAGARQLGAASRQLRAVTERQVKSIRGFVEIAEAVHRWAARLERLRGDQPTPEGT
jgi:hypothetical protein